ncbi:MAG: Preprotein translocase subunit SecD [Parcubacteria group bacterium GW2011_GWB1_45_10]|nr:MAG: Preprotein translocase subunit SecD [Parcubacteria group bacterium GW2011_GWB1_45_10]
MFSILVNEKKKAWSLVGLILVLVAAAGIFVYPEPYNRAVRFFNNKVSFVKLPELNPKPFRLGLDIAGGTSLTYSADVANLPDSEKSQALQGLKDVIERRINIFGVEEPRIEVSKSGSEWRLIVEIAGIKDINQAINAIGQTPFLEFKEERDSAETNLILEKQKNQDPQAMFEDPYFKQTSLTGRYLEKAEVQFNPTTYQPNVLLQFNDEGAKLFEELTSKSIGRRIAIYIDGMPLSAPTVQEAINNGSAQITGQFNIEEAKALARNLNQGALPVPITLISQRSVGGTLGFQELEKSLFAGIIGFAIISVFMILIYRLGGFFSVLALAAYVPLVLAIFKIIPVTMTLSGIAGFILSIGMAVDANILILERIREEIKQGREVTTAIKEGFLRAWPSIRDSNVSTIITALILYFFTASIVRGFALTLLIGVIVSMFSAIFVSRTLILAFLNQKGVNSKLWFRA